MAGREEWKATGMAQRGRYTTRQRQAVLACMDMRSDVFLSVDDVRDLLSGSGETVGRTTVYRTLETLVEEGVLSKVAPARGVAARYKRLPADPTATSSGQLCCLGCGRAMPLDCGMLDAFSTHVRKDHGFVIDRRRTVLYGYCQDCLAKDPSRAQVAPTHEGPRDERLAEGCCSAAPDTNYGAKHA